MTDITTTVLAHARSLHERERIARAAMHAALTRDDEQFSQSLGAWLRAYGEWAAMMGGGEPELEYLRRTPGGE